MADAAFRLGQAEFFAGAEGLGVIVDGAGRISDVQIGIQLFNGHENLQGSGNHHCTDAPRSRLEQI
jgi:hypothetical protein